MNFWNAVFFYVHSVLTPAGVRLYVKDPCGSPGGERSQIGCTVCIIAVQNLYKDIHARNLT